MAKQILQAKDYSNRADLEKEVVNLYGKTVDKKEVELKGTREELANLGLSGSTIFWGINCVELDPEPKKPPSEKPNRGEIKKFGININA